MGFLGVDYHDTRESLDEVTGMGKGRVTRQISVLEEVVCAAEASFWILYIGYKRQSSLIDECCDEFRWARAIFKYVPLGPSPAAYNRRQLQIVCTHRADNFSRYLICH